MGRRLGLTKTHHGHPADTDALVSLPCLRALCHQTTRY